ncbi:protein phosphatase 2C domain-containing protein [Phytoactinopolyspora alkaliphila]|uniref:Protein phosphatase 2C domain-containing protein n=1 Tax=Phytoactinopolyspora alkaliphila TaxID=1783498 RepID=A0A6N9YMQ4_9ACTN|nr:protein phosphatase 2C domain-containing protein [Phytoactinopolyspora alkaliphila]NED96254.1 protein phosphatase 2C domain-containing protein [Phytoactinopolyspora alkaliphila]
MYTCFSSAARHDGVLNEDFVAATTGGAVVIDGAGTPEGADTGCVHGVAWYSRALGHALVARLADLGRPLRDCLAQAIIHVRDLHGAECDLGHPGSPSSTVTAIRENGDRLDYLVLADSPLVIDLIDRIEVICDHRVDAFEREKPASMRKNPQDSAAYQEGLREYIAAWRRHRNVEGGFWVASSQPDAAAHALTGTVPLADVKVAALLSDGASRLVDRFGLLDWRDLLDLLDGEGPGELIRRVRDVERDTAGEYPGKVHDDATAAYCQFGGL